MTFTQGDNLLLSASMNLAEGKDAMSLSMELADPLLEIAAALPLPTEDSQVPVVAREGSREFFSGYLKKIKTGLGAKSPGRTKLEAEDEASGARRSSQVRVLVDASAASQVRHLAEASGLAVEFHGDSEAQLDAVQYGQSIQRGRSDVAWLQDILTVLGHTHYVRNKTIHVLAVGEQSSDDPLEITLGSSGNAESLSFEIETLTKDTSPNVYSRAGDSTFEQNLNLDPTVQARAVRLERTGVLFEAGDLPSFTDQTLEQAMQAQGRAEKIFAGKAVLTGLYLDLDVDKQVLLRGVSSRFSGIWNIEKINHHLLPLRKTTLHLYNGGGDDSGGEITFMSDVVMFRFDVDTIDPQYEGLLDRVAARLTLYDKTQVAVVGHADEVGSLSYNQALSLRRAQAVYDALVARGVPATRLSVEARGETEPTGGANALNRRVEFEVK